MYRCVTMLVEDEEISAKSKNKKKPWRKIFHRKPSAKALLEEALAARRKSVHQHQDTSPQPEPPIVNHPRAVRKLGEENKKRSFFTRTKFFRDMTGAAFEMIDADGSGEVDEKELYSGLLLIHLKLGTYAGPAACRVGRAISTIHVTIILWLTSERSFC